MTREQEGYRAFVPGAQQRGAVGWDAWAEEYARLPQESAAYRFTKRLLYDIVDAELDGRGGLDVLDFNCGCGNDFPYFLDGGHRLVGCDGSAGMLEVAARRFPREVACGRITLYQGRAEDLAAGSFGDRRFDVIFCSTGGTAYLTADQLRRLHVVLRGLLAPAGRLVVTHLRPRCLSESLLQLARGRPRAALLRWRASLQVSIRSELYTMYLRGLGDLAAILDDVAPARRVVALNVVTPPFQTGIRLPEWLARRLAVVEKAAQGWRASLAVCDQIVWISDATGDVLPPALAPPGPAR